MYSTDTIDLEIQENHLGLTIMQSESFPSSGGAHIILSIKSCPENFLIRDT